MGHGEVMRALWVPMGRAPRRISPSSQCWVGEHRHPSARRLSSRWNASCSSTALLASTGGNVLQQRDSNVRRVPSPSTTRSCASVSASKKQQRATIPEIPGFQHPDIQRAFIKKDVRPQLTLAVRSYLIRQQKQQQKQQTKRADYSDHQVESSATKTHKFTPASVDLLAEWNGFYRVPPDQLLQGLQGDRRQGQARHLRLSWGLLAEASDTVDEDYIVYVRPAASLLSISDPHQQKQHPPFVVQDPSLYRAIESRINDLLDQWEEGMQRRQKQQLNTIYKGLQYLVDKLLYSPTTAIYHATTSRLGPLMDLIYDKLRRRSTSEISGQHQQHQAEARADDLLVVMDVRSHVGDVPASTIQETLSGGDAAKAASPQQEEKISSESRTSNIDNGVSRTSSRSDDGRSGLEDLLILTKDGSSLMILKDVDPAYRLLALPKIVPTAKPGPNKKPRPPYRLRFARSGAVITTSIVSLSAIAPAYRSLKFALEYPRTAEVVTAMLVGGIAYSLYNWSSQAKANQEKDIAAAVLSRVRACDAAALSTLAEGAVDTLANLVLEDYLRRINLPSKQRAVMDEFPGWGSDERLISEIGLELGLLQKRQLPGQGELIEMMAYSQSVVDEGVVQTRIVDDAYVALPWYKGKDAVLRQLAESTFVDL